LALDRAVRKAAAWSAGIGRSAMRALLGTTPSGLRRYGLALKMLKSALVLWPDRIQKLRDRRDKLGRSERLGQENAGGHAARSPLIGMGGGDVDDGKFRVDLPGLPGDFPPVHCAAETDVRHERAIRACPAPEQGDR